MMWKCEEMKNMETPLQILITNLEQIAAYYKLHEQMDDYKDLRKVLDDYYEAIETPDFNFEMDWDSIGPKTREKFVKKARQIENDALQRISEEEKIDIKIITEGIDPLDPESEWDSFLNCHELPADINWIEYEMDFFKEELAEKGIL